VSGQHELFVYGSLKRGLRHHAELRGAVFLGEVRTAPRYRLVLYGAYPALTRGDSAVAGELYRVDEAKLARLDDFEGCPDLYRRDRVELADGRHVVAYLLPSSGDTSSLRVLATWPETD
jgi:gamma-glutamylaminecyclotransferase